MPCFKFDFFGIDVELNNSLLHFCDMKSQLIVPCVARPRERGLVLFSISLSSHIPIEYLCMSEEGLNVYSLVMGRAGKSRARAGPGRAEKNRFGPPGFRAKPEIL